MKGGGATPKTSPTGWVFFRRGLSEGFTIRWQRGEREAYVLKGNKVGSWTMEGLLGKIPVSANGWVDLTQIRMMGEQWVRAK
jgi:hypothetical protein